MYSTKTYEPYPYQKAILDAVDNSETKWILVLGGRKVGKTIMACESALKLSANPLIGKVLFATFSHSMAHEVIKPYLNDAERHCHKTSPEQRKNIKLISIGDRSVVGFNYKAVVLDDVFFAKHEDVVRIIETYSIDAPMIIFATIPNPKLFPENYQLLKKIAMHPRVHVIKVPSSQTPFWEQKYLDDARAYLDDDGYKTEMEAEFID
jgi:hypothetical protein